MQHIIKCMDFLFLIKKANVSSGTLAFFFVQFCNFNTHIYILLKNNINFAPELIKNFTN